MNDHEQPLDRVNSRISELLAETQQLLAGFESGSLSPVPPLEQTETDEVVVCEETSEEASLRRALKTGSSLTEIDQLVDSWSMDVADQRFANDNTALHIAAELCDNVEVFKMLIRRGGNPLLKNTHGQRARSLAQHAQIADFLEQWERRLTATGKSKLLRLVQHGEWRPIALHFAKQDAALVSELLSRTERQSGGWSPLHEAAARNHASLLRKLAHKYDCRLDTCAPETGNTPLHDAAWMSAAEAVETLLDLGADQSITNAANQHPGDLGNEQIRALLASAAEPNTKQRAAAKTRRTKTLSSKRSADLFVKATKSVSSESLSREERKLQQIIGFLDQIESSTATGAASGVSSAQTRKRKAPLRTETNVPDSSPAITTEKDLEDILQRDRATGRTILHRHARRNQTDKMLAFLVAHGLTAASIHALRAFDVTDNDGHTPLHEAALAGATQTARVLLFGPPPTQERAGDCLCRTTLQTTTTGNTPLHEAASAGHTELVRLLLDAGAGADAMIRNKNGELPGDLTGDPALKALLSVPQPDTEPDSDVVKKTVVAPKRPPPSRLKQLKKRFLAELSPSTHNKPSAVTDEPDASGPEDDTTATDDVIAPSVEDANAATSEPPARRGPGRPRKHPRTEENASASWTSRRRGGGGGTNPAGHKDLSAPATVKRHLLPPSPPLMVPFATILDGCDCLILVKMRNEWCLLSSHLERLATFLDGRRQTDKRADAAGANGATSANGANGVTAINALRSPLSESDRLRILHLPSVGRLVTILQTALLAPDFALVEKSRAVGFLETHYRYPLTGPFGYIDVPRLLTGGGSGKSVGGHHNGSDGVAAGGCPLKLKMKLLRPRSSDSTADALGDRSPHSFQI